MDIKEIVQCVNDYPLGRALLLAWFCFEGLNPDTVPEDVRQMREAGLEEVLKITDRYHGARYCDKVVVVILLKKLEFLSKATQRSQIREILKVSHPKYDGQKFLPGGPFHIDEEEMLAWSETSLRAPLISDGVARYQELFERFFGPLSSF